MTYPDLMLRLRATYLSRALSNLALPQITDHDFSAQKPPQILHAILEVHVLLMKLAKKLAAQQARSGQHL